ncbi:MAG: EF-hand domain-containing protein [archaeon]|nr:EF-hand domain-containing protein [archaeon]
MKKSSNTLSKSTHKLENNLDAQCRKVFREFDKNGDGSISADELEAVMIELGLELTKIEIQDFIREGDIDGSGKIEYEEFLRLYEKSMNNVCDREELIEAFEVFDRQKTGLIKADELIEILKEFGEKFNEKDAKALVDAVEKDSEGYIHYKEFINTMVS